MYKNPLVKILKTQKRILKNTRKDFYMKSISQNKAKETRIFKAKKEKGGFTQMDNKIINNPDLSFKAKAILLYALSRPSYWKLNVKDIANHSKESETAIRNGVHELIDYGHMKRYPKYENNKIKEWVIEAYEKPIKDPKTLGTTLDVEKLEVGNLEVGKLDVGNHHHYINTELSNKDFSNKEGNNKYPPSPQKKEKNGEGDLLEFIKGNFSNAIKNILYEHLDQMKERNEAEQVEEYIRQYFTIGFLKEFKQAHEEQKQLELTPEQIRKVMNRLLYDMERQEIKSVKGLLIHRFKKEKEQQNEEEIPPLPF